MKEHPTPLSSVTFRPHTQAKPQNHSAVVVAVGWTGINAAGEHYIGPVRVKAVPPKWLGKRVRAALYPSPNYPTIETLGLCRVARVRAAGASEKNTTTFEIVGHLIRAEQYPQRVTVEVLPQTQGISRFRWEIRTTKAAVMQCDPSWTGVRVTGSLLDRLLLAEDIQPAYAPIARHWKNWGRPKRTGKRANVPPAASMTERDPEQDELLINMGEPNL